MNAQVEMNFAPIYRKRRGSFYVTTPLPEHLFPRVMQAASNQDEAVMAVFRLYPGRAMSPSQVHELIALAHPAWEKGSIRRSMTTLTDDGWLEKTSETANGPKGRPEHLWKLPA